MHKLSQVILLVILLMSSVSSVFATDSLPGPVMPSELCNSDGSECHSGTPSDPITITGSVTTTITSATVNQGTNPWVTSINNVPHVILDSGVITSITNPVAVTGTFWQATQPISGTVTANAGTGTFTVGQATGTNLHTVLDSGTLTSITNPVQISYPDLVGNLGSFTGASQIIGPFAVPPGFSSAAMAITNTWSGSIKVQTSIDGITFFDQPIHNNDDVVTIATVNGLYHFPISANLFIQIITTSWTSGQADIDIRASSAVSSIILSNPIPSGPNFIGTIGLNKINGTTVITGGVAGSLGVGGVSANNTAITQNPLLFGIEANSGQPSAATTGNQRQVLGSLDGAVYARPYGPVLFSCGVSAIGTTLTQCQAVPGSGLSLYITDVISQSNTATAGKFTLQYGTGANCGTGTGNLFFGSASALMASPANTVAVNHFHLTTPIKIIANNAVCVLGVVTNVTNAQINGFIAP